MVQQLWNLPELFTPLTEEYKNIILTLSSTADDNQYSNLVSQTLWAVDIHTNFTPYISPICVFNKMIKVSLQKKNGLYSAQDRMEALVDYEILCQIAIRNSVNVGLKALGCPHYFPQLKPSTTCQMNRSLIEPFLRSSPNIPIQMQSIIRRLINSKHEKDRNVGIAALASYWDCNQSLFNSLMNTPDIHRVVQLKACKYMLPSHCCEYVKKDLSTRCASLEGVTKYFISKLKEGDC